MAVRAPEPVEPEEDWRPAFTGPTVAEGLLLGVAVSVLLLVNGRPIGAGDTRANEYVAASLVEEGDLDLDEHPHVEPPFTRTALGHRVSNVLRRHVQAKTDELTPKGFRVGCPLGDSGFRRNLR